MKPYTDHFSRLAPSYASCRPGYPDQLFAYLASLVDRRELAWDCAAGSGQATLALVNHFNHVVATDLSRSMLDQAPAHRRIEYRVAPAQASGLAAATVDLVTVAQALHWLDITPFYVEVERVLVPGGILAVWTYGAQELDEPALQRELTRFYSRVVGPCWPPERRHVESGYRTLPFPFPDLQPPAFRMEQHWIGPCRSSSAMCALGQPLIASGSRWDTIPWIDWKRTWRLTGQTPRRHAGSAGSSVFVWAASRDWTAPLYYIGRVSH